MNDKLSNTYKLNEFVIRSLLTYRKWDMYIEI